MKKIASQKSQTNQSNPSANKSGCTVDISRIMRENDAFQKCFFDWLALWDILWIQETMDTNFIRLQHISDYFVIKIQWDMVSLHI